jgi:hypothetical protein
MATVQLSDLVIPVEFTKYIVKNTMEKSALYQSGVVVRNAVMAEQLAAGAESFSVPHWLDLANDEANITTDNPATLAVPHKIGTGKQIIRKTALHSSWSAMNLASELAGDNALARIQARTTAYWDRQVQRRLIASLTGIQADNVANDSGDMVLDISALVGAAAKFSAAGVIDCAGTLGDGMEGLTAIALHSDVYRYALKNDLIANIPDSQGGFFKTFRGLAVIVDDSLPLAAGVYTSVLFGPGAVGFAVADPRIASGTEVENTPSAGNGGGQQTLHSRVNVALHPLGFSWLEGNVAGQSPTIAECALAANWNRVTERKAAPLAYLVHKI